MHSVEQANNLPALNTTKTTRLKPKEPILEGFVKGLGWVLNRTASLIFATSGRQETQFFAVQTYSTTGWSNESWDWSNWANEGSDVVRSARQTRGRNRWRQSQVGGVRIFMALGLAGAVLLGGLGYGAKNFIDNKNQPATSTTITASKDLPSYSAKPNPAKFSIYRFLGKDATMQAKYGNGDISSVPGRVEGQYCQISIDDFRKNNKLPEKEFNPFDGEDLKICRAYEAYDPDSAAKIFAGINFYHDNNPRAAFPTAPEDVVQHNLADGSTAPIMEPESWQAFYFDGWKVFVPTINRDFGGTNNA